MIRAVGLLVIGIALGVAGVAAPANGKETDRMKVAVRVEWKTAPSKGTIEVRHGRLAGLKIDHGKGDVSGGEFRFSSKAAGGIGVEIAEANLGHGANPTVVQVEVGDRSFSFLVRDVKRDYPIFIPDLGVAVTEPADPRTYEQIASDIEARGLQTILQRINTEPEEDFEDAAAHTRQQTCPIWLGISRDIRNFQVLRPISAQIVVEPLDHYKPVPSPEKPNATLKYAFTIGRGTGVTDDYTRRLEDGVLPILHAKQIDDDIAYNLTFFATLEKSKLTAKTLRGTNFLLADGYGAGHMFTEEQQAEFDNLEKTEFTRDEETVLFARIEAVNTGKAPHYAWFKNPRLDKKTGRGVLESGLVSFTAMLNGEPMPQEEVAVLLSPGEKATIDLRFPHRPVSAERATAIAAQDFSERHAECRDFWRAKLTPGAKVRLPDERLTEMIQAGLLHLDLITYGLEPDKTVAPFIGVYCPIGSESSPIMHFYDSMGWHDLARRSLQYFLDKQHDDGFMQNFGGYMLETGAALWSIGEHYRYTRDDAWVKEIEPKLIKSCDFLIKWRERNLQDKLKGRGYGMLEGKVADPEDPFHIYMLNGYAYLGLSRVSEMLAKLDPKESKRIGAAADALKEDIRATFFAGLAKSPVVPMSDGTWCSTSPPWAEADSPVNMLTDGNNWFSHGTHATRDSMLGPHYLVFQEVIAPEERAAKWLLDSTTELFHQRNVAFSQPYYSRHPWINLRLGQTKAFLKAHYNAFVALADRQTYTFAEHLFFVSNHKTHEEGWFLMQTRWMLWLEEGDDLKLLAGIPRRWLENGKKIKLENVATYFGPVSLKVESCLQAGYIKAVVTCDPSRKPERLGIRLPHPQGQKPVEVVGGTYDPATEAVWVKDIGGKAEITVRF